VAGAVSLAGSSDFLIGKPSDEQALTSPTSGVRKKFMDAVVVGGVDHVSPLTGAAAVSDTYSDTSMIGCVYDSGASNWVKVQRQVGVGIGAIAE